MHMIDTRACFNLPDYSSPTLHSGRAASFHTLVPLLFPREKAPLINQCLSPICRRPSATPLQFLLVHFESIMPTTVISFSNITKPYNILNKYIHIVYLYLRHLCFCLLPSHLSSPEQGVLPTRRKCTLVVDLSPLAWLSHVLIVCTLEFF